jgi:hypothetical protein
MDNFLTRLLQEEQRCTASGRAPGTRAAQYVECSATLARSRVSAAANNAQPVTVR